MASAVLAGVILGMGFYGAWIGTVVAIALTGAAIAATRLPRRSGGRAENALGPTRAPIDL
jgi:hypothetical protein